MKGPTSTEAGLFFPVSDFADFEQNLEGTFPSCMNCVATPLGTPFLPRHLHPAFDFGNTEVSAEMAQVERANGTGD